MQEFEVRFQAHHYAPTSCLAHAQCATLRMNTVFLHELVHPLIIFTCSPACRRGLGWGAVIVDAVIEHWKCELQSNLSGMTPSGKTTLSGKTIFQFAKNSHPPLDSMQTEPVWNDHLSGKTTFSWHLGWWLFQTGFTVVLCLKGSATCPCLQCLNTEPGPDSWSSLKKRLTVYLRI